MSLSRELGNIQRTVAKWRKRQSVEEATIVAFRRHMLLAQDDCRYALQPSIPHLTHSALQRHGLSRLSDVESDEPKRQKFKRHLIGFFHIHCPAVNVYMHERGQRRGANR